MGCRIRNCWIANPVARQVFSLRNLVFLFLCSPIILILFVIEKFIQCELIKKKRVLFAKFLSFQYSRHVNFHTIVDIEGKEASSAFVPLILSNSVPLFQTMEKRVTLQKKRFSDLLSMLRLFQPTPKRAIKWSKQIDF